MVPCALAPFAVWHIDLSTGPADAVLPRLSRFEMDRAGRFRFATHRRRYLTAHTALRQLLERHCGVEATSEIYAIDHSGKYRLADGGPWYFNLSYAGDEAVIGISRNHAIGIDIEPNRPIADAGALAQLHFDADERIALRQLAPSARNSAFLQGWTRKEACLKTTGIGLHVAPASFHTGLQGTARVAIGDAAIDIGSFRLPGIIGAWAWLR